MLEKDIIPYDESSAIACHRDPSDLRDYSYDKIVADRIAAGAAPVVIDWVTGYDIRNTLGDDVKKKLQGGSSSCVGQGWSYYLWVKQVVEMMAKYNMDLAQLRINHAYEVDEISAKVFYSQIFLSSGGAYIRDGAKLAVNWGALFEKLVPSVDPVSNVTTEEFMRDLSWRTEAMIKLAKVLQGLKYATIEACDNMDLFAQAIMENHGVVGGVVGQNGRGWGTENPLPPSSTESNWQHCLYYGAFGTDELGKFIATPNSWGNAYQNPIRDWKPGDPPGDGWQKLRADYFNSKYQFNPWTYVDKNNINIDTSMATNAKIIKDANSSAVGIWLPAINEAALESYCLNMGISVPKKDNGEIDWDNLINGTLTLK